MSSLDYPSKDYLNIMAQCKQLKQKAVKAALVIKQTMCRFLAKVKPQGEQYLNVVAHLFITMLFLTCPANHS